MRKARGNPSDAGVIGRYAPVRYEDPAAAFRPADARCPAVARRVAGLIRDRLPGARVEHVGSTAVPGCPGKGVVDLMLPYAPGELDAFRSAVEGLGFQLHLGRDPFPPARPVFVGTLGHDGVRFRIHLHLIPAEDPEAAAQRRFRDALRADPALVTAYAARKRAVLAGPERARDATDYNRGKDAFIRAVIDGDPTAAADGSLKCRRPRPRPSPGRHALTPPPAPLQPLNPVKAHLPRPF